MADSPDTVLSDLALSQTGGSESNSDSESESERRRARASALWHTGMSLLSESSESSGYYYSLVWSRQSHNSLAIGQRVRNLRSDWQTVELRLKSMLIIKFDY